MNRDLLIATVLLAACSRPQSPSSSPTPSESPATSARATPVAMSSVASTASPAPPPTSPPAAALLPPDQYVIRVEPTVLDSARVRIDAFTNIPGTIEVMAAVSLAGQKGDDVYVGTSERMQISNGSGSITLSVADLPKGSYDAEIDFYPRWGFKDGLSRSTGIAERIHAAARIRIGGSGESAAATVARKEGQKWVAEHLTIGDPLDTPDLVRRFGKYEELPVEGFNPDIIKAYYFPRIDVTVFANVLRGEVSHWRFGRANS